MRMALKVAAFNQPLALVALRASPAFGRLMGDIADTMAREDHEWLCADCGRWFGTINSSKRHRAMFHGDWANEQDLRDRASRRN